MTSTVLAGTRSASALPALNISARPTSSRMHCVNSVLRPGAAVCTSQRAASHRPPTWQARARREGSTDDGWQTREEWQESRANSRRRTGRPSGGFDPLFDAVKQAEDWEYRAEQIQRDAQRTARQATDRLGLRDYRVAPVRGDDLAKMLIPAAGLAAAAVLAGPVIGFVLGMGGLVVGATLFSGSMFFALTFAAPLILGASVFSMLGFWTFGIFSVLASLALPALMLGGAVVIMRKLAGNPSSGGGSDGGGAVQMSAEERAAAAAAAKAEAEWRQQEEEDRQRDAELRDFDRRLGREERSRDRNL